MEPSNVGKALATADLGWLAIALAVLPAILVVRADRWRRLVRSQGLELGAWRSLVFYAFAVAMGAVTPGRLGEFSKIGLLRKLDLPLAKSTASVLLDRVLDLAVVAAAAAAAFPLFEALPHPPILVAFLLLAIAIALFAAAASGALRTKLRRVAIRLGIPGLPFSLGPRIDRLGTALAAVAPIPLLVALIESVVGWAGNWLALALLAHALGLSIPFLALVGASSISALASIVPISILNIGTRDALYVLLLSPFGVSPDQALALSALTLLQMVCYGGLGALSLASPLIGRTVERSTN